MKKLLIVLMAFAPAFASAATGSKTLSTAPTGDSCGLGWQVTQSNTIIGAITRSTTNATVPPTFGMTSGTIGCAQLDFAQTEMEAVTYAVTNYDALSIEMASGQGETLAAFARTLGCNGASSAAFGKMTQSRYGSLVGTSGTEMYKNVKAELASNSALRCGV